MVTKIETTPGTVEWIIDELQYLACNPDDVDINKLANMIHHEVTMRANRKAHEDINRLIEIAEGVNDYQKHLQCHAEPFGGDD